MPTVFFVFSLDSGDVDVEPDVARAAASIEPPDVDLAEVFDETGRRYALATDGRATTLTPTSSIDRVGLEQRLRSSHTAATLLIDEGADFILAFADALSRWKWENRFPRWPRWLDRRLHGEKPHT